MYRAFLLGPCLAALCLLFLAGPELPAQDTAAQDSAAQDSGAQDTAPQDTAAPEAAAASPLAIAALRVTPERPGPDTLCRLAVDLTNGGEGTISVLELTVEVAGQALPVYRNQVYMKALPPGETTTLQLYNFWTSETGRPFPSGDTLPVEVTLREARWVEISTDDEGVEVWQPGEAIPGLPVSRRLEVPLGSSGASTGASDRASDGASDRAPGGP